MNDYEMEESISSSEIVNRELIINDLVVDRLSELPLGLIHHILSFLPMREVVATSFLSKKWKNMWTIVPFLNFSLNHMAFHDDDQNFLNRVLMLWKGARVLKFEIDNDPHFYISAASDMDSWVIFAVANKVLELNIDLIYDIREYWFDRETLLENYKEIVYSAPQCLYSCSSIKKLRLVGCKLGMSGSPSWYQLTSLIIGGYCFSKSSINSIMSGSPQLEVFELRLLENYEDLNIVSASLKKLKIEKYLLTNEDEPSSRTALRICCPNLETLEILGALYSKCVFTDVSSLTNATIGFYDSNQYKWQDKWLENVLRRILTSIQHVEKLALSYWCVQVLGESKNKHLLSPLQKVKFLKLDVRGIGLGDMMALLGIFPNVKALDIKYLGFPDPPKNYTEFEANLPKSFLHQLKIFEISLSIDSSSELWFFEVLLKRAILLEKLVIRVKNVDHLREAAEKLESMPRSSPTAKVIFNPA